ncbi:MAG: SPASM domain-containing protein [Chitinispirillales bacterium]|nr:SPASM domain-containing protein [Chitinispirillales bacterium]
MNSSIAYNGDVYLCCNGGAAAENVCDKSFNEVWKSERYNELRAAVNHGAGMPERCETCAWFNR